MNPATVARVCQALDEAEVRYLAVGGLAVIAHGYVRMTMDLDLVVELSSANAESAIRVLRALGYRPRAPVDFEEFAIEASRQRWRSEKQAMVLSLDCPFDPTTPIDLFLSEPFDFALAWAARALFPIGNATVPVVGLATLIEMKRAAGRLRDLADIAELEQVAHLRRNHDHER